MFWFVKARGRRRARGSSAGDQRTACCHFQLVARLATSGQRDQLRVFRVPGKRVNRREFVMRLETDRL